MKYQSELIKEIVDTRGHKKSSIHYESECVEEWVKEVEGAYPKLIDYQSEWLNYIIENPIGEFPYEAVTNVTEATVNNVVPYAYKSAILSGQTLVNLANYELSTSSSGMSCRQDFSLQKNKTAYTLFNFTDKIIIFNTYTESSWKGFENVGANSKRLLTLNDFTIKEVIGREADGWDKTTETEKFLNGFMIIEGDYTNVEIPYFTGMQSVKIPVLTTIGKNLFDGEIEEGVFDSNGKPSNFVGRTRSKNFIKVPKNTDLYVSIGGADNASWTTIYFYNDKKEYTSTLNTMDTNKSFNTGNNSYIKWKNNSQISQITNVQIEQGTAATSYEPFKSNILTVNEDVTLRGIGEVRDTLDCLTGEVVERVGETRFNGDFSWELREVGESYTTFRLAKTSISSNMVTTNSHNSPTDYVCNALNVVSSNNGVGEFECIWFSDGHVYIRLSKDKATTIDGLKQYLNFNDITIQYLLKNEFIKTVDLTVIDQDGNTLSRIKPIEGTMHIHSDGTPLKPTITLEIPVEATTQNLASFIKEE